MNTTDTALAGLLTGDVVLDAKLREAYSLGVRHWQNTVGPDIKRSAQIDTTCCILATLMRAQQLDLNTAMSTLQIPRAERKTYIKLFHQKEKRRREREHRNCT